MKIEWKIVPSGAHVAHDAETGQQVGNVWMNFGGTIEAYPWAVGLSGRGIVTSFEAGRAYVEGALGAERTAPEPVLLEHVLFATLRVLAPTRDEAHDIAAGVLMRIEEVCTSPNRIKDVTLGSISRQAAVLTIDELTPGQRYTVVDEGDADSSLEGAIVLAAARHLPNRAITIEAADADFIGAPWYGSGQGGEHNNPDLKARFVKVAP